jgi:hypothetical protein
MNLRVPHPLRSLQRVGYANVGIEILGSHPLQRTRRIPDFLLAAPSMAACAAFYKESRMKFVDPATPYRKSGDGAPGGWWHLLPNTVSSPCGSATAQPAKWESRLLSYLLPASATQYALRALS